MLNGRKVIQVTPAYAPAELFRETRRRMGNITTPGIIDEFWLLLLKYPLPSIEANEAELIEAAAEFGYKTFAVEQNMGESANVNAFLAAHPQPPGTIYIKFDADAYTLDKGYDEAIATVMCADPKIAVCSLAIPELRHVVISRVGGYHVFYHPSMMRYDIAGTDLDFVKQIGGFRTPDTMWGGLEGCIYEELLKYGRRIVYLLDHKEADTSDLACYKSDLYGDWKWENYFHRFTGSFDEYLQAKGQIA